MRKIQLTKSRDHAKEVLTKLNEIATLCKAQSRIQLLLSASDFIGALNLIAKSRLSLNEDFKDVICLRYLDGQLDEIETLACTMIQRVFDNRVKESNYDKLLLNEFNKLTKLIIDEIKFLYEDQTTIPVKVNGLVKSSIEYHLRQWEAKPPVPSIPFTHVAQLLTLLHDSLHGLLPANELKELFFQISLTFKEILLKHLRRLNIKGDAGPQQWLVSQELTFYRISLSKLSVFKGYDLNFDDIWLSLNSSNNN